MNNIVCFHNPEEENGWLSNWYLSNFRVQNICFTSMEQYLMYQKAIVFNDINTANTILEEHNPAVIKQLGRKINNYDELIWNGISQIIAYRGILEKFTQNEELGKKLAETESAILAECAVNDKIWGIGKSMKDPERFDMHKWTGQNLLGFTTMQVRNHFFLEGKDSSK